MPDKILNSRTITGPLNYVVRDNDDILNVDTTLGIVTLVFANIRGSGFNFIQKQYYVNDIGNNASVNNIILVATNGDLINNNPTVSLTQNGSSVQVQISSQTEWLVTGENTGGGGGGTFINPNPMPISVGGFGAGTTFPIAKTMQEMWDGLLYPYQNPAFTSFNISGQSTLIEVGVALAGLKTFLWGISNPANVQPNSVAIRDVNTNTLLASGLADDGSEIVNIGTIVNTSPISQNWRGEAINSLLNPFQSGNFNVSSIYPIFFGKVASGGAGPGINRPLSNQALINSGTKSVISSTGTITINFGSTADDYIWFAVPDTSPLKTVWFISTLNTGAIGGAVSPSGNLFPAPTVVSINSPTALWSGVLYKIYVANYQSGVIVPMDLRNS